MKRYALALGSGKKVDRNVYLLEELFPELEVIQASYGKRSSLVPEENHILLEEDQEINQIKSYLGSNHLGMVVNRLDSYIPLHGKVVDAFNVSGPSSNAVSYFRYKSEMHQLMLGAGLDQYRPRAEIVEFEKVDELLKTFDYPVVVKPYVGSKSKGVFVLKNAKDWSEAKQRLVKHFESSTISRMVDIPTVLVEEYVDGRMIAPVCYVDHQGKLHMLVILDVVRGKEIGQRNMQLVYRTTQSSLTEEQHFKVNWLLQELVTLSGLRSTFLDPELFVTKDRVSLIEINVRLGGLRAPLLKGAFGIDLNKLVVELASGQSINAAFLKHDTCTAVELWEDQSGMINSFLMPDVRGLIDYSQSYYEGDVYIAPPFSNQPLATFYVPDQADSLKKASQIRQEFKVNIRGK